MAHGKMKDETRREFMIKAGKIAVYTPPALMMLMHPSKTKACSSAGGKRPHRGGDFDQMPYRGGGRRS